MTTFNTQAIISLIDKMSPELEKIQQNVDKMTKTVQKIPEKTSTAMTKVTGQVKTMLGAFIGFQAFQQASNYIKQFDRQMSFLRANIDKADIDKLDDLKKKIMEVSEASGVDQVQLAGAVVEQIKAGIATTDILEGLDTTVDFVINNPEVSAGAVITAVNQARAALGRGAEYTKELGDIMQTAADVSMGSFTSMADAFSRAGSAIVKSNLNHSMSAAVLAKLTDALGSAERAGTGFNAFLVKLTAPTSAGMKILRKYKLSMEDINPATNNMKDIMEKLAPLINNAGDAHNFFGDQADKIGSIMLNNIADIMQYNDAIKKSAGSTKAKADIIKGDLTSAYNQMLAKGKSIILTLGNAGLDGVLKGLYITLGAVATAIGWVTSALSNDWVQGAIVGVGTLIGLMKVLNFLTLYQGRVMKQILVITKLQIVYEGIKNTVMAIGVAITRMTPWGMAITAISIMIGLVTVLWQKFGSFLNGLKAVGNFFTNLVGLGDKFTLDGEQNINKTIATTNQSSVKADANVMVNFANAPVGTSASVTQTKEQGMGLNTGISMSSV